MARRKKGKCRCAKWAKKTGRGKRRCVKRVPKGCSPRKR